MKSAVFLYNTQSGKCKIGHCTDSICTVFRAYGYEITPQPIDFEANPFDGNEQIDLMVVAGGDGTVNYVVNSMKSKGLDIPLGVIPAGTANDFAGALGMSHKPLEAARQIASGAIDRVDCGCVNGLYFVNIFSFGIFTTTSQRTPDERKPCRSRSWPTARRSISIRSWCWFSTAKPPGDSALRAGRRSRTACSTA